MTHAQFKKIQLDHLIDEILEARGDPDHAAQCIVNEYPTDNVQDYMNTDCIEFDAMTLTKSSSSDPVLISNTLKKQILAVKGFWKCWGDNSTLDWTCLMILNFDEYLSTDAGPNTIATAAAPVPALTTAMDVTTITNALSAVLLTKPPSSRTDIFLKNKGRGDEVKPLKEAKQWNSW